MPCFFIHPLTLGLACCISTFILGRTCQGLCVDELVQLDGVCEIFCTSSEPATRPVSVGLLSKVTSKDSICLSATTKTLNEHTQRPVYEDCVKVRPPYYVLLVISSNWNLL